MARWRCGERVVVGWRWGREEVGVGRTCGEEGRVQGEGVGEGGEGWGAWRRGEGQGIGRGCGYGEDR